MSNQQLITPNNISQLEPIAAVRCGFITQVACSPDGGTMAVSNGDGVWFWRDGFGGAPTYKLQQHSGPVKGIAFSPDSRLLASVSSDTTARLWNVDNGDQISVISGFDQSLESVTFDTTGTTLALGCADGNIYTLPLRGDRQRQTLVGHGDEVTQLVNAFDTATASASRDTTVRLWSLEDGSEFSVLSGHSDWVRACALQTVPGGGAVLASAGRDATVRVWSLDDDPANVKLERTLNHEGDSRAVAIHPHGDIIAADDLGTLRLWSVSDGAALANLTQHTRPIVSLAFHPNGKLLISGSGDNSVILWGVSKTNAVLDNPAES